MPLSRSHEDRRGSELIENIQTQRNSEFIEQYYVHAYSRIHPTSGSLLVQVSSMNLDMQAPAQQVPHFREERHCGCGHSTPEKHLLELARLRDRNRAAQISAERNVDESEQQEIYTTSIQHEFISTVHSLVSCVLVSIFV